MPESWLGHLADHLEPLDELRDVPLIGAAALGDAAAAGVIQ